jgi:uncharacterized protein (DUF305 family)
MNKKTTIIIIVTAVVALIVGICLGCCIGSKGMGGRDHRMMKGMDGMMKGMMMGLEGKTGDEFDQAFLSEMITHHEGAVVMAEAALVNAQHQEIKDLSKAIIEAQNKEIADMKAWNKAWYQR